MNSFRVGDRLSRRLKTLRNYHSEQKIIWDIGCDHGQLGLSFLESTVTEINLVDPSELVIKSLYTLPIDAYIQKGILKIHYKEGQKLNIDSINNLIFIAGMGGKEIGEIIVSLIPQLDDSSQFVISPHRKILELRSLLHSLPLSLISEQVIFEDGQFYQVLVLRPGRSGEKVSLYGEKMWEGPEGREYLAHQLKVYKSHRDSGSQAYFDYLMSL